MNHHQIEITFDEVDGFLVASRLWASLVDDLREVPGAARVDGNVTSIGVYVISEDAKVVSGFGPPAIGGSFRVFTPDPGKPATGVPPITRRTSKPSSTRAVAIRLARAR